MSETTYYSQHGEDIIARRVVGRHGYFVEVGVIDGRRFSNTLALEKQGWRGMCVEAHPGFVERVRRHRPNSVVMHAAASDTSGSTVPFYADPRGDLSSLVNRDVDEMRRRFGRDFKGFDVVRVPLRTLDEMLIEASAPRRIDVVSIDIEGAELPALRGFDLDRWRPRLLILEADDAQARRELDDHLIPRGYRPARCVGVNVIYTRHWLDALRVRLVRVDQQVLHTANPADPDGIDTRYFPASYETRGDFARRLIGLRRAA